MFRCLSCATYTEASVIFDLPMHRKCVFKSPILVFSWMQADSFFLGMSVGSGLWLNRVVSPAIDLHNFPRPSAL